MAVVVIFAMMYRNPAVALMPDITPKPLRSKANGIINIMGYIGGAFATVVGMFFVLTEYLGTTVKHPWQFNNIWTIEIPFLVGSVLMLLSAIVLFLTVKENKIAEEVKEEMIRGEEVSEAADKLKADDEGPMTPANKRMLFLILGAEFFWFMADNGIGTFMTNYTRYHLEASTSSLSLNTIISGLMSVVGFVFGGIIASKIGRKWTLTAGLLLTLAAYATWLVLGLTIAPNGKFPFYIYAIFAVKGFGMSLVHVNSFPMVVELCNAKKIGRFTGLYYASSMLAQTITPTLIGLLLLTEGFGFGLLPLYALACTAVSAGIFFFVKSVKLNKTKIKVGLEALDQDD